LAPTRSPFQALASVSGFAARFALYDVTDGTNFTPNQACGYLCTAGPGYDGPTGLGTPNGIGAF